jgi:hypothetical protein
MNVVPRTLLAFAGTATAAVMFLPVPAEAGLPGPIPVVRAWDDDTPPSLSGEPSVSPEVSPSTGVEAEDTAPGAPEAMSLGAPGTTSPGVESPAPMASNATVPPPNLPRPLVPGTPPVARPVAGHVPPKRVRPPKPVLPHAAPVPVAAAVPVLTPPPLTPPAGLGATPPIPPTSPSPSPSPSVQEGPAPALPEIAPRPAPSAPSSGKDGISELTMLAPAGALQAGRVSWATVIAVAIVAEAGLLWLVTGLTVLRKKKARGHPSRQTGLARILRILR